MESVLQYYRQLPLLEWAAVITALGYVVFAARNNIWCWPLALISTALYTVLFYEVYLWMDSILQVYYFGMAIIGWLSWRQYKAPWQRSTSVNHAENSQSGNARPIISWQLSRHIKICGGLTIVSFIVGWVMAQYTPTHFPYVDSFTTVFAVFATYLVTQKVIENWWYWVVIDVVSIYVYIEKQLLPTAVLFIFYVVIAVYGFYSWRQIKETEGAAMNKATAIAQ